LSCVRSRLGAAWGPAAIVAVVLVFLCSPLRLNAQALSGINGTVTDQSGAAIEGASVKITNVDTNVTRAIQTTSAGTYYMTDLIPGTYDVRVEKSGFQVYIQKGVVVVGGATSTASATLVPGAVATEIVVNASSVALETEQPEVGTTVNETLTQELPQIISGNNRQIDNFIYLTPGVTGSGFSHRIDGGVDQQTEVMFNGVPEAFSETAGYTFWNQPPYDSIKDVDVLSGTFSAQYGLGQGVEQYHVKSGSNTIHGDAFYFYRDDVFLGAPGAFYDQNANNSGVVGEPNTNIQSDWGGSVGGPVYIPHVYDGRNKTFWFVSYDRYRQSFTPTVVTLPTAAEVGGDFSAAFNPASPANVVPIYVPISWTSAALIPAGCVPGAAPGAQWPGNKIPTTCFSQESAALLKQFPLPTPGTGLINNYTPTTTSLNLQTDIAVNIDHNLTKNQAIHGLYWRQYYPSPNAGNWVNNPLSDENITTILGRGVDITYSNAISSHIVVTAGFLYVYQGNDFLPPHLLSSPITPVPPSGLAQPLTFPSINFNGGPWEPQSWGPGNGLSSTKNHKTGYSWMGNLLWQTGRHTMNIGVDIRHTHQDDFECGGSTGQPGCSGVLNFTSDITADPNEQVDICGPPPTPKCVSSPGTNTGIGFASFLLGDVTSGGRGGAGNTNLRNNYVAPYFQDNIQINPKLKINAGIRWDLAFPFTNDSGTNQLTFFNPSVPNPTEISTVTGQPLLGAMSELGTCTACVGFSTMNMQWHHFSPRLGFTYQLTPKTVILGGVSFYWLDTGAFEYGVNKVAVNYGNNLNGVVSIGQSTPQVPGFGEWDTNTLPPLPAVGFSPTFFNGTSITGGAQVHELPRNVNQAYDQQFLIGVQRELPWNMFLSASYVHTHDIHLPATLESGQQSLNYNFVKSVCPQGSAVTTTLDCALASNWNCTAQTFNAMGNPAPPCQAAGTQPQALLQSEGFGQVSYAAGTCGAAAVTLYAPYTNFCQEQGTGAPLFVAELPFPQMPFVTNNFDTSGADLYNALQVSVQKRTGSGLTYLLSYTLSHYDTNTDSGFSTFNSRGLNPQNPNAEWSVGSADQTHVLTIAGAYELPIGPGKRFLNGDGMLRKNLLGGWKISWVQWYESGPPVNLDSCADQFDCDPLIGNIFVANRPNQVSSNYSVDWNNYYKSLATWNPVTKTGTSIPVFNTSNVTFPGAWTIGNSPVYLSSFRYPWYLDEDASFAKRLYFGERVYADLRIQWFNLFNRNLLSDGPGSGVSCFHNNLTGSQFGSADSSPNPADSCQGNTPRRGQFQLQVNF
ncbi:MAG TPA: carboxypeptidase regulatory-like domain-containing protein, partial [Candidatus Acidoferrales bacterium]|nr:carboxypeptidase regulatory-like domain-containing protein [Candidatus Acidoferrales bacterium]